MGLFGKKDKKKEKFGFFSRRKKEAKKQEDEIVQDSSFDDSSDVSEFDVATQAIAEREAEIRAEEEKRRLEAEAVFEQARAEAAALAAQAAKEAEKEEEEKPLTLSSEKSEEDEESEEIDYEEVQKELVEEIKLDEIQEEQIEEVQPEEMQEELVEKIQFDEMQEEQIEETQPEEVQEEPLEEISSKPKRKSIFEKIKEGLKKTKDSMISKMQMIVNSFTKIDEDLFEQLEETMIMSDMGADTSIEICEQLRKRIKEQGITDPSKIMDIIQEIIGEMLGEDKTLDLSTKPSVIMVIGVNGAGKTTTIGKLCHQLKEDGKKVIVAAADTFRAAAIDQLEVWTERAGVDIVKHTEGSDPGAVVYDAIEAAKARDCDVLICDTAGRLHNKKNLMQELAKISRIIKTKAEGCAVEVLLVLDATTGQNAVNQARLFKEVADITGIVLTKLDGTAKGGIIVSIKNELDIPVKLIGVGEKIDDLQPFSSRDFVTALFEKES